MVVLGEGSESATPRDSSIHEFNTFSAEACSSLGASVESFLETGAIPEDLVQVTARLCREAQARGLSADATLRQIRGTLGEILACSPLTSSDRAALVALAIDECVHAFYGQRG